MNYPDARNHRQVLYQYQSPHEINLLKTNPMLVFSFEFWKKVSDQTGLLLLVAFLIANMENRQTKLKQIKKGIVKAKMKSKLKYINKTKRTKGKWTS